MTAQVLILGSAPDAVRARNMPRDGIDAIVAINNAWAVRPDWDWLLHPSDFAPERRPATLRPGQAIRGHEAYVPAVNAHGGFVYVGGTMAFTAAYWTLHALRPRLIAVLGCDMVYANVGANHFYGRGTADPLRDDPTLQSLEAKSARFLVHAAEAGCAVVNLSDLPTSRLAFARLPATALPTFTAADGNRARAAVLTKEARARIAEARADEDRLGYRAPDGKYWKRLDSIDPAALRRIDALWLAAARSYSDSAAA